MHRLKAFITCCGIVLIAMASMEMGMYVADNVLYRLLESPEARGMWVGLMVGLLIGWLLEIGED